jgi:tetratricopeptide (TPR) repeat protein/Icc-related predicted phosphoesterase
VPLWGEHRYRLEGYRREKAVVRFNWLHLTDLHLGMKGYQDLWQFVEEDFYEDLKDFVKDENGPQVDPLDLVVFTGDLVQSGSPEQFEELEVVLGKLWDVFREDMGFEPKLLVVPGNHDLTRPSASTGKNPNPVLDTLTLLWDQSHVYDAFWEPDSVHRELVNGAFANYVDWWKHTAIPKPKIYWEGELPGDFSATIEKEEDERVFRLGIAGLNSTFLQLTDGATEGDMALSMRQFNKACAGRGRDWAASHNLSVLLTHHPPEWLNKASQPKLGEIHDPPRFALHLFGHVHESDFSQWGKGGAQPFHRLQGSSLFSVQRSNSKEEDRRHGYSLGQLKIPEDGADHAELRIWPRSAERSEDWRWSFGEDRRLGPIKMDRATTPLRVEVRWNLKDPVYQPEDQEPTGDEAPAIQPLPTRNEKRFQTINPAIAARDTILIARLDMLQQKLSRIPRWLESDLEKLEVDRWIKKSLLDDYIADPLKSQQSSLGNIHTSLKDLDPDDEEAVSNALDKAWSEYLKVYLESQRIFRDCLELMGGLALRDRKLDERICEVADELIRATTDHVRTTWYSFTILAQREAFQWTISRIIRLRFPEWTIWSLPFAANEFGHVMIGDKDMFQDILEDQDHEWQMRQLEVVLADIFATYVMGPAYVCAAVCLWLDPSEAAERAVSRDQADDVDSDHASALGIRGALLYVLERYEEALDTLDRALAVDENYAFALETKGLLLRALKRDQEAEVMLSRAVELDPDLTGAHAGLGNASRILGRNKKILEDALEALDQDMAARLSDATRAYAMFAVLDWMNVRAYEDTGAEPYKEITSLLRQRWQTASGQGDGVPGVALQEIQLWDGQNLEGLLNRALGELAGYSLNEEEAMYPHSGRNGIEVAERWAEEWRKQVSTKEHLSMPKVSSYSTLRDVLNAAWLCRIRAEPDEVDQVAEAAYLLCERIINPEAEDAGGSDRRKPRGKPPATGQLASSRQGGEP